jgi:hypothetical protein
LATNPEWQTCSFNSERLQRESGKPDWLGNSQAKALTCTTSSGGKSPGAARAGKLFQPAEAFVEEAFAPLADNFAARIQPSRNDVVGQVFGRHEDNFGPEYLKIRQRIFGRAMAEFLLLIWREHY